LGATTRLDHFLKADVKMAQLLSDPAHHTKGAMARDARGLECDPESPEAQSWCVLGALNRCYPVFPDRQRAYICLVAALKECFHQRTLVEFNDTWEVKHDQILNLVRTANV
jgi:hypothetical protein